MHDKLSVASQQVDLIIDNLNKAKKITIIKLLTRR